MTGAGKFVNFYGKIYVNQRRLKWDTVGMLCSYLWTCLCPPIWFATYIVHVHRKYVYFAIHSIRALFNIHICSEITHKKRTGNGKAILNTKEMFKIQCPIFIIQCVVDFRLRCRNKKKLTMPITTTTTTTMAEEHRKFEYTHIYNIEINILWSKREGQRDMHISEDAR